VEKRDGRGVGLFKNCLLLSSRSDLRFPPLSEALQRAFPITKRNSQNNLTSSVDTDLKKKMFHILLVVQQSPILMSRCSRDVDVPKTKTVFALPSDEM
jgi:hypothetical protein